MGVIQIDEDFDGRRGSITDTGDREYTRVFNVQTDNPSDGSAIVMFAVGIPRIYSVYSSGNETDLGAFCKSVEPEQDSASRTFWKVTCRYDSKFDVNKAGQQVDPDPTHQPAVISWTSNHYTRVVSESTTSGVAIKNSAGDTFDPPVTSEWSRPVLNIAINRLFFDPSWKYDYENAINSDPWFGQDAKCWLCRAIDANLEYASIPNRPVFPYWAISLAFEHNRDKWNPAKILDIGYNKLNGTVVEKIKDKNGEDVSFPVRLDGSGAVLSTSAADVFRSFNIYREVSFGALGLT